jgi:GT2 family glycosyltransferase
MVAVVIVNYNSASDVERCLKSLSKLSYKRFFTIIVDGASPDGSGELLRAQLSSEQVDVVLNPENSGFAASSNLGIRLALARDAQFVWLLNPDTEVDRESLNSLLEASSQYPEAAAFGSKVYYGSGHLPDSVKEGAEEIIWCAGGSLEHVTQSVEMRGNHEPDRGQYDQDVECDYLPGCSLFIRSSVLEEVGVLPEEYFMYFEETEWCRQVRRTGGTLMFIPDSKVWHYTSDSKMQSPSTIYYYNRNQMLFWYRAASPIQKIKLLFSSLFIRLPRSYYAMRMARLGPDAKVFRAHFNSVLDFLLGRYGQRNI